MGKTLINSKVNLFVFCGKSVAPVAEKPVAASLKCREVGRT